MSYGSSVDPFNTKKAAVFLLCLTNMLPNVDRNLTPFKPHTEHRDKMSQHRFK